MKENILIVIIGTLMCFFFYNMGKSEVRNNLQQEVKNFTGVNPEYLIELDNDSITIFGVSEYHSKDKVIKLPIDSKIEIGEFFILDNQ